MLVANSNITIDSILSSIPLVRMISEVFHNQETEVIKRPASFIVRLINEPQDRIQRIILLPPFGCTANRIDETNSHPEARKAKIEAKGAIRVDKRGFSQFKNIIRFQYYPTRIINDNSEVLNPKIGLNGYIEEIKSSKDVFYVVRENGKGFYHSIINITPEWVVLLLDKELRYEKAPDIRSKIMGLDKNYATLLINLYDKICLYGDEIFEYEKELIKEVCTSEYDKITPALVELLNVLETGKHEACTIFALILKKGRNNPEVIKILERALANNEAPKYYLEILIRKLAA